MFFRFVLPAMLLAVLAAPRLSRADESDLAPILQLLAEVDDAAVQLDLLTGIRDGLKGRKSVAMPAEWSAAYAKLSTSTDAKVRDQALAVAVTFGDPQALAGLKRIVLDGRAEVEKRQAALESLLDKRTADLVPLLHHLLADGVLRRPALRGLAVVPHPETPAKLLAGFASYSPAEKTDAIGTLASRPDFALALLSGLEQEKLVRADISAFAARQLYALGDARVTERLRKVWGEVRESSAEKQEQIAKLKRQLSPNVLKAADPAAGKQLFNKTCQQCHTLFGEGGKIGPELTGSNRANLDYILSNIVDPSAEIGKDYQMSIVVTDSGRVLTGMIVERLENRLTIQTATERVIMPRDEVESIRESPLSMMPEGQLDKLTPEQIRDLIAYLATKSP